MGKIRNFFAVLAFISAAAANATATVQSYGSAVHEKKRWSNVALSYNAVNFDMDMDVDHDFIHGIDLGYLYAVSLSANVPLYIEGGLLANCAFGELYARNGVSISASVFSLKVPLNLGYKVNLGRKFSLLPYAGLYFKGNLDGEVSFEYKGEDEDYDMFDKDEGNGERFQFGMNAGIRCYVSNFSIGVAYGLDFNEVMDDTDVSGISLSVGLCF